MADSERYSGVFAARLAPFLLMLFVLISASGCTGLGFVPSPRAVPSHPAADAPVETVKADTAKAAVPAAGAPAVDKKPHGKPLGVKSAGRREADFAGVFDESAASGLSGPSARRLSVNTHKRPVRVMLRRNAKDAVVYSAAAVDVRTPGASAALSGRIQLEASGSGALATDGKVRKELRLPCTLLVSAGTHLIELGENSYRGALVIVSESPNVLSFINVLDVEDYLRGVVPLEIGNLAEADIEAVKAQAVAARTYSYRKMAAGGRNLFDMVATVADQVYGGANAEAAVSDAAIRRTKDIIMVHENDIVRAYYHSTCGGKTASIEDIWGGETIPYLRSRSDTGAASKPFCAGAGQSFAWTETWTEPQLSGIIRRYSAEGSLTPPFTKGSIKSIEIGERFGCGRVKTIEVLSSTGQTHTAGGDKLRFVFRRNTPNRQPQILRSSNINSISIKNNEITITGSGNGHGVGMCQTGAIARARAGQSFEQILQAYYTGITIKTVSQD